MTRQQPVNTKVLRQIESVCPVCLQRIGGQLIQDTEQVYLAKKCPEHGSFCTTVWRGLPTFSTWFRPKLPYYGGKRETLNKGCPFDCGLCEKHTQRTCTALVEITSRCNLNCPVCFAGSGAGGADLDLATLQQMFDTIMAKTGGCNLQLSGGEPTVRDDLPQIVALAKAAGFEFVQLNSNGIRLAEDPQFIERLQKAGLSSVFLQFDGVEDEIFTSLRGRELFAGKCRAIDNIGQAGVGVVLVPTIVRGINDEQLWDIVRFGLKRQPHVRGVHFQPMSYFGRFPANFSPDHVTLPEIMHGLAEQSTNKICLEDFKPPGCEHALCSFSAKYMQQEDGQLKRLGTTSCDCNPQPAEEGAIKSIGVTANQWSGVTIKQMEPEKQPIDELEQFLRRARTHTFSISGMAFQDCWSLNLERLQGCCIHVAQPDGRLIPFCSFNLTARDGRALHRR